MLGYKIILILYLIKFWFLFSVTCELESGEKFTNISLEDKDVPQSADVVLVVAHSPCNSDLINKLDNVINQIDSSLKELSIKKPRFSVVGYGGKDEPHSHTMDGELFNSKYKFSKATENFHVTQTETEDALEALEYAARLPFRAGVSKSIILVPCADCTEQAVNYADVQRLLFQRDIRLHVLKQEDFKLKADKTTSYIFGKYTEAVQLIILTPPHPFQTDNLNIDLLPSFCEANIITLTWQRANVHHAWKVI